MAKIGISIKLDVKKLDKARFFAAQSGALYVDLTMFLDPENEGSYGDHGFITQSTSKEEREQQVQMPILGNGKIFYGLQELQSGGKQQQRQQGQNPKPQRQGQQQQQQQRANPHPQPQQTPGAEDGWDDQMPF